MSIKDILLKIKTLDNSTKERIFVVLLLFLVAILAFGLGRLSVFEERKTTIQIENLPAGMEDGGVASSSAGITVYSSNTGSVYYYATCTGISRLSQNNKISFKSAQDAESYGLHIAPGCTKP